MVIRVEEQGKGPSLTSPLPDELLSSWVRRNPRTRFVGPEASDPERDFGEVEFNLQTASARLLTVLRRLAIAPHGELLPPSSRTFTCDRCDLQDWATGSPLYRRRAWALQWRSTCPLGHGPLSNRPFGSHRPRGKRVPVDAFAFIVAGIRGRSKVDRRRIAGGWLGAHLDKAGLTIVSRRGTDLENALQDQRWDRLQWKPNGFNQRSLRKVAGAIADALMNRTSPQRNIYDHGFLLTHRFRISVLTEAILADWSGTPLPTQVGNHWETQLLVKLAGWPLRSTRALQHRLRVSLPTVHPVARQHLACVAKFFSMSSAEVDIVCDGDPRRLFFDINELARLGGTRSAVELVEVIAYLSGEFAFNAKNGAVKLCRHELSRPVRSILNAVIRQTGLVLPPSLV